MQSVASDLEIVKEDLKLKCLELNDIKRKFQDYKNQTKEYEQELELALDEKEEEVSNI